MVAPAVLALHLSILQTLYQPYKTTQLSRRVAYKRPRYRQTNFLQSMRNLLRIDWVKSQRPFYWNFSICRRNLVHRKTD